MLNTFTQVLSLWRWHRARVASGLLPVVFFVAQALGLDTHVETPPLPRHPTVLRVTGHRAAGLFVKLLQPVDIVRRHRVALRLWIHVIDARRI